MTKIKKKNTFAKKKEKEKERKKEKKRKRKKTKKIIRICPKVEEHDYIYIFEIKVEEHIYSV